jgi:hypothetical protein
LRFDRPYCRRPNSEQPLLSRPQRRRGAGKIVEGAVGDADDVIA